MSIGRIADPLRGGNQIERQVVNIACNAFATFKLEADLGSIINAAIFTGAFTLSMAVIYAMVAPQWRRILSLAAGHPERSFAPLQTLAIAERRIAVRRWAAASAPLAMRSSREAA